MKYICLKCKVTRKKKIGEKTYKKVLQTGKIIKVPQCCGHKMELVK
jgi:hypothetical protein